LLKGSPLGRLVKPEEVAAAVLFLCLPETTGITGTALPIAGGEI
jgi:NAD(P)-dependent dehydrogenase (short-subunit alcohol dehydrogenase family)